MKLRFYPKKAVVRGIIQESLDTELTLLSEADTKLAAINNSKLWKSDADTGIVMSRQIALRANVKALQDRLTCLDSHDPPEVMCEVDL